MAKKNTPAPGWSVLGRKNTKIVATIGPASADRETLKKMIKNGMNVARLNFSHGEYEWHGNIIKILRELSRELHRPIGILADLQGPRMRTLVDDNLEIKTGEVIRVSDIVSFPNFQTPITNFQTNPNDQISKIFFLDYPEIIQGINVGNEIMIEDGVYRVKVVKKEKEYLEAEVMNGGIIKNHKGINIPDASFHFGAVTAKDEKDLEFALENDVDFVGLSFVSNGKEIEETREKIKKILGREPARNATPARNDVATSGEHSVAGGASLPQIISKVERKEAIKNIDEIIKASDVIMVARGDLGIEMDESKVVIYQKEIIAKCLKNIKPVIVATQMLDSMIGNPIPTRAEVADVSNAVIDHADAVMLSGESANGKYPVEAVEMMSKIICNTEDSPFDDINPGFLDEAILSDYASVISSAHELAKSSDAAAIVMLSESGFTARMASHHRPSQLMFVATDNLKTYNQLALVWGIKAYLFSNGEDKEHFIELLLEKLKKDEKILAGDKIVVILGRIPGGKKMRLVGIRDVE